VTKFRALSEGVPLERGRQRGVPPNKRYFAAIGSFSVRTVADKYRPVAHYNKHSGHGLSNFINMDDLERP